MSPLSKNIPPMIRIQDAKVGQAIKFYNSDDTVNGDRFGIVSMIIATADYDNVSAYFDHGDTFTELPKNLMVHNLGRVTAEAIHHIHQTDVSTNSGVTHV